MIKLQDTIIQTDTQSVLDMLKFDLAQHGVDRFHQFRHNGDNIQTSCPFHKNGQERKPSFGVMVRLINATALLVVGVERLKK